MALTKLISPVLLAGALAVCAFALESSPAAAVPASAAAASSAPAAAPGPAAEDAHAKGLFESACSSCHDSSVATQAKQTPAQWANTVDTMVSRGAPLDDKQAAEVADYLARHYSAG